MRPLPFALLSGLLVTSAFLQVGRSEPPRTPASQTPQQPTALPQIPAPREDATPGAPPLHPAAPNPNIDMDGFLKQAAEAARHRATRRLTEADFLKMSREPGTIVLDARSQQKFDLLHIRGAINISFPDIDIPTLEKRLPDKNARILIYCNNNFRNADVPFAPKSPAASLNLSTYVTLYQYGYRNVYELGPQLDPKDSILPFESGKPLAE